MVEENLVLLTSQKDVQIDDPELEDVYEMGTIARVKQLLKLPNGTFRVLVEGVSRGKVVKWVSEEPCYVVQVEPFVDNEKEDIEFEALRRTMLEYFEQYIKLSKNCLQIFIRLSWTFSKRDEWPILSLPICR